MGKMTKEIEMGNTDKAVSKLEMILNDIDRNNDLELTKKQVSALLEGLQKCAGGEVAHVCGVGSDVDAA